jgi:hypothetical protein
MRAKAGAISALQPPIATHADAHGPVYETTIDGHHMRVLLRDRPNDTTVTWNRPARWTLDS